MNISVTYLSQSPEWQAIVDASAARASKVLSDRAFIAKVRAWPSFDDCALPPGVVADHLDACADVAVRVGFYYRRWFTKAIAYEQDGAVYFNTAKRPYGAGSPGNVAHEVMHALGYVHNGNSASGNENTVPYRIGQWVEAWPA